MENRWSSGIWLHIHNGSHELIIGTPMGCIKVKDIKRYASEDDQWDIGQLNAFRGVPWEPTPGSKSCEVKAKVDVPRIQEDIRSRLKLEAMSYVARRFRITKSDFDEVGLAPFCPICRSIVR